MQTNASMFVYYYHMHLLSHSLLSCQIEAETLARMRENLLDPDDDKSQDCDTVITDNDESTLPDALDDISSKSMNGNDLADSYCANFSMLERSIDSTLSSSHGSYLQSSLTVSKGKDSRKSSRGKRRFDNSQQFSSSKKSKT